MMAMIAPVRTVAPATEPVTLQEAKDHLRVTHDLEDTLIAALIDAAVSNLDGWSGILGRCIVSQTWRQDFGEFTDCIRLPFPDVQSVTVAYTDDAGNAQTVAGSEYHLVNRASGAVIELADGAAWPSTYTRPDAVRVTMVCGYAAVPAAIKAAILLHVGALYENRASVTDKPMLPFAYDALVGPHRRLGV